MTEVKTTAVITQKVRFSYAHVFEPKAIDDEEPKYSVALLVNKDDSITLKRINAAVKAAIVEGKAKFPAKIQKQIEAGKMPTGLKLPLRDGDEERPDSEEYTGVMFLNASSKNAPGVIGRDKAELFDDTDFYSGCFGRASINFYAFSKNGNNGVAAGLNNLQKLADGERLSGGGRSAEEDFADDFEGDLDAPGADLL